MQFNYFDIHSHLNLKPLLEEKAAVLARMREQGIGSTTVGIDYDTSKLAVELAEANPDILWATVGLHPNDVPASFALSASEGQNDNESEVFEYEKYLELAKHPKVVAIGETGLDYFRLPDENNLDQNSKSETLNPKQAQNLNVQNIKQKQKELFDQHIKLAIETSKPLMIHARPSKGTMDAYEDVLDILETYNITQVNFHFFVGDITIANRIVQNNWTMSFDGPITFSRDYDEVIRSVPLENIMAETDAPFASPVPHRGKTCEPWMVVEVYKKIAEIRGLSEEHVRLTIVNNTKRVFNIH